MVIRHIVIIQQKISGVSDRLMVHHMLLCVVKKISVMNISVAVAKYIQIS